MNSSTNADVNALANSNSDDNSNADANGYVNSAQSSITTPLDGNTSTNSSLRYTNDTLSFSLQFPDQWEGFEATEYIKVFPVSNEPSTQDRVLFEHPRTISQEGRPGQVGFSIIVYYDMTSPIAPGSTLISESDGVRYVYAVGNGAAPDDLYDLFLQIDDIIQTFQLI